MRGCSRPGRARAASVDLQHMPDHVMNYIECDAPAGVTLVQWRRARLAPAPRRRLGWLRTYVPVRRPQPLAV